jgi:hypothetical protein
VCCVLWKRSVDEADIMGRRVAERLPLDSCGHDVKQKTTSANKGWYMNIRKIKRLERGKGRNSV